MDREGKNAKKRILLIATTPFLQDGLTKIELDVLSYNKECMDFTIASRFGYDNEIGRRLQADPSLKCLILPPKKRLIAYQKAIKKLTETGAYDAVYIHGNSAMMLFEARPAKKGGAKRVVTHCHNTKSNFPLLEKLIKKKFNRNVDAKIACSRYVADFAYDGERVVMILNGPDLEKFKFDPAKRQEIRDELGLTGRNFVVGHVGRFNVQKNHRKLIEIFEALYQNDREARLLLVGEGELLEEIRQTVARKGLQDAVIFIGKTDRVADYYHAMDIMVMPSLHEGLCLVAMEAQANGLPLLVADTFSPETLATESAEEFPLDGSAEAWAQRITDHAGMGRRDNTEALVAAGLDQKVMMEKIKEALIGPLKESDANRA